MRILVFSETSASNLQSRLGTSEYSYYFVLREFLPVLQGMGEVQIVECPEQEVDAIYLSCRANGQPCVFLSFSPPHRTRLDLLCPTIPVFAWEFDTIPHESWLGRAEEDWSWVIRQLGRAITHSASTVAATYRELEPSYPLLNAPAPVWDSFAALRAQPRHEGLSVIRGHGALFDSTALELSDFLHADPDRWHAVVHDTPLPVSDLEAIAEKAALFASLHRKMGQAPDLPQEEVPPPDAAKIPQQRVFDRAWWQLGKRYVTDWYAKVLADLLSASAPHEPEVVSETLHTDVPVDLFKAAPFELILDGVVFTSVFNPYDGRKNWQDLLSAFCSEFSETPDAILLFKLTHRACTSVIVEMLRHLARLPRFQCQVILLHGYLEEADYQTLVGATAYVVNASYGEGQCLPLMEFLSCGKPAIAPDHSGMSDYIDARLAFIVASWEEATGWPHDPRFATRTHHRQISWVSLRQAFAQAYSTYRDKPESYAEMAEYAIERMRQHCSRDAIRAKLEPFLCEAAACG
jgi:glycosyltransferase involved in cell wall biosynthesis